jgi:glutathionylspermidine synthase
MQRHSFAPREDWQTRCEEQGFKFHTNDGVPYWQETAGYGFSMDEIDHLEAATAELHAMCMEHVMETIKKGDYSSYGLPDSAPALIERSWREKEPHLYGRFDFAYNGSVKLLEYNADTPTSLLEAAVIQWTWKEDRGLPDQFNSLHEKLIARWKYFKSLAPAMSHVYFTTMKEAGPEDWGNIAYHTEVAFQAGIDSTLIDLEAIGWDQERLMLIDIDDCPIETCFKLYPWEWMLSDEFADSLPYANTRFIEPAWKMLLSNKALLPLLWQKHKGHPLLLPTHFEGEESRIATSKGKWIRKPILAREGANVSLIEDGRSVPLSGSNFNPAYDNRYVVQQWQPLPEFAGWHPVIGSWVVGDEPAGMSIREDRGDVTGNMSCFVSHFIEE